MNHDWECISVGEYDSLYECKLCKKRHTESVDKIGSERPATGCQPDDQYGKDHGLNPEYRPLHESEGC